MKIKNFVFINAGGHIDVYLRKEEKENNFISCLCYALKGQFYFLGWNKKACKMAEKINKQLYKIYGNKDIYKSAKKGNNDNKKLDY